MKNMNELERHDLVHEFQTDEQFFKLIDKTGGWPVGYRYISFYHAVETKGRYCIFTNHSLNTGFWTTFLESDDYYHWKISDKFKDKARAEVIRAFLNKVMPR